MHKLVLFDVNTWCIRVRTRKEKMETTSQGDSDIIARIIGG